MLHTPTREGLLNQASGLHDIARRARRAADKRPLEGERKRLLRHAEELEEQAMHIEEDAANYWLQAARRKKA